MLDFGDIVVVRAVGDVPDVFVGDDGEVVGLSDDGDYVGVYIHRIARVYTFAVDQVQSKP